MIYKYVCKACSHTLEVKQSMKDAALTICPVCNKDTLVKELMAAPFHLKGSGFYQNDYKGMN